MITGQPPAAGSLRRSAAQSPVPALVFSQGWRRSGGCRAGALRRQPGPGRSGRRQLAISRATYNRSGSCWQFVGTGGQSSLVLDPQQSRWGHEISSLTGGSRSMLVPLWGRRDVDRGRGAADAVATALLSAPKLSCRLRVGIRGGGQRLKRRDLPKLLIDRPSIPAFRATLLPPAPSRPQPAAAFR